MVDSSQFSVEYLKNQPKNEKAKSDQNPFTDDHLNFLSNQCLKRYLIFQGNATFDS